MWKELNGLEDSGCGVGVEVGSVCGGGGEGRERSEATGIHLVVIMQIHVVHTVGTSSP